MDLGVIEERLFLKRCGRLAGNKLNMALVIRVLETILNNGM
jgi:hypothetical protein